MAESCGNCKYFEGAENGICKKRSFDDGSVFGDVFHTSWCAGFEAIRIQGVK